MFLMPSQSVNSPETYLQKLIKTTGHQGAVFVASEKQFFFKLLHIASNALTAISVLYKWIKIRLADG